jgi:hypothetical protein
MSFENMNKSARKKMKSAPMKISEWIEFYWLQLTNPTFRAAADKRKAYFEHRLGKSYTFPCW